jgi:putative transposase
MIVAAIAEAERAGASVTSACGIVGISLRTLQRWQARPDGDDERRGPRRRPGNALRPEEEATIVAVLTSQRYAGISPKQLVPMLADEGVYLGSDSTFYRIKRRRKLQRPRPPLAARHVRATHMHRATGPNQVWSWDITWLPTNVRGKYLYLYMVMDVWSRCVVGWAVEEDESSSLAAELVTRVCREENIDSRGLVLHADNGNAMRGSTMLATLQHLGVIPSFSRPHVSDDNPYSESLFRTVKHTPAYPPHRFASPQDARAWVARFVAWYNGEHRHSGIRFVTPDQRHQGRDVAILAARQALYDLARRANPERWTGTIRDWSPIPTVTLNPERAKAA